MQMEYYLPLLLQYEPSLYLAITQTSRYCRNILNEMNPMLPVMTIKTLKAYELLHYNLRFSVNLLRVMKKTTKNAQYALRILHNNRPSIICFDYARPTPPIIEYDTFIHVRDLVHIIIKDIKCKELYIYVDIDHPVVIQIEASYMHYLLCKNIYIYSGYNKEVIIDNLSNYTEDSKITMGADIPPHIEKLFKTYKAHIQN